MAARQGDGVGSGIERWLSNLGAPDLAEETMQQFPDGSALPTSPAPGEYKCPVCDAPRNDYGADRDRYDEDYEYHWGGVKIPLWMALIWQVPWRQRLDIFVIGLIVGLVVAGTALFWGFVLSQY